MYPAFSAATTSLGLVCATFRLKRLRIRCLIGFMGPREGRSAGRGMRGHCSRRARYSAMPMLGVRDKLLRSANRLGAYMLFGVAPSYGG